jgi:two-component system C4-dicarboxylate transport response regulator DctD
MISDAFARQNLKQPGKVLVVDEEADDLKLFGQILENQGFEVSASTTFEGGVQYLNADHFDFVVVSQGGPAFEGRRVLKRAGELDRHLPVVVLTRSLDMPCYLESMQLGAIDYLEKPVEAQDLVRLVEGHVRNAGHKAMATAV